MDSKKPKQGHSTGFHGNQYVDSQGRRRTNTASTPKTGAKHKTTTGSKAK